MLVTQITTHVADALNRLMQQYRNKPNMAAVITALVEQIQDLEDALFPIDAGRQLWNGTSYPAVGAQLDGIGELVGIQRNGLSDAEYLIFIIGTIAENFSDTTITTLETIATNFFMPTLLTAYDMFPAEFNFEVSGSQLDPSFYDTVGRIIQNSLGAGIRLGFIATFDETDAFVFSDAVTGLVVPGSGLGFDDATSPGGGGMFATVIYNNSGD